MKKILLSFLCCMLAVIGMQAEELTFNFAISGTISGLSTASGKKSNDTFTMDGYTFNATSCYKNNSNKYLMLEKNYGVLTLPSFSGKKITAISVLTGTGASTSVKVALYSENEMLVSEKTLNAKNATFTWEVSDDDASGKRYQLKVTNDKNAQFQNVKVTYTPSEGGEGGGEGGETPDPVDVAEPTFTPADGTTFEESLPVTINVDPGLTAWYTTVENGEYTQGNTLTIDATTTVWAKAVDAEGNESDVVNATYTKNEPLPEGAITKNFVVSEQGYANVETITSVTITDGITVTFDKGNNTSNPPKYYNNGSAIRCYGGNIFRVNSQVGEIVKVVLTFGSSDGSNGITTDCGTFEEDTWTGNANIVTFSIDGTSGNRRIASIEVTYVPFTENIVEGYYYLELAPWADGTNAWYAMYLCNKNNYPETGEWVVGYHTLVNDVETVIYDYTGDNAYTHMIFCRMDYDKKYVANWDNVIEQTDIITFTPATTENYFAKYVIDNKALPDEGLNAAGHWSEFEPNIGTGIDRVEATAAIRYANGVVAAEGAIEVYNVNGMVVARGNESLDLRNLNAGVYIVRNGNNVRKVVR